MYSVFVLFKGGRRRNRGWGQQLHRRRENPQSKRKSGRQGAVSGRGAPLPGYGPRECSGIRGQMSARGPLDTHIRAVLYGKLIHYTVIFFSVDFS